MDLFLLFLLIVPAFVKSLSVVLVKCCLLSSNGSPTPLVFPPALKAISTLCDLKF